MPGSRLRRDKLPYPAFRRVNAEPGDGTPSPYGSLLKTQNGEPRNIPKVPDIGRAYAVSKFECGHAD